MDQFLPTQKCLRTHRLMALKIGQIPGKRRTRIRLREEFRSERLDQVKAEIGRGRYRIALDLAEVNLVDLAFSMRGRP